MSRQPPSIKNVKFCAGLFCRWYHLLNTTASCSNLTPPRIDCTGDCSRGCHDGGHRPWSGVICDKQKRRLRRLNHGQLNWVLLCLDKISSFAVFFMDLRAVLILSRQPPSIKNVKFCAGLFCRWYHLLNTTASRSNLTPPRIDCTGDCSRGRHDGGHRPWSGVICEKQKRRLRRLNHRQLNWVLLCPDKISSFAVFFMDLRAVLILSRQPPSIKNVKFCAGLFCRWYHLLNTTASRSNLTPP